MLSNPKGHEEVRSILSDLWAPVRKESVCDWVEENVELPSGEITGKVQLSYLPYGREILERFTDRSARNLVMMFPTQSGKTSILIMGMLYRIARDPRDALWVMGNTEQVRAFNKERMMPFVHFCPPVLKLVPRTKRGAIDRHWWGFQNQHYETMTLNFVGAGSSTNLKSRPRAVVVMDEVDSYDEEMGFDSGVIQLVEERQKTFTFPLSVKASSPTVAGRMITAEYNKTDMRQFWIPCPRCNEKITLQFRAKSDKHGDCGLRWWHDHEDEARTNSEWDFQKVKALAHYRCQHCGGMIHDFERRAMLQEGEWKPQRDNAPRGWHGYQINSMYSTLGQETSLGNIACKFLLAKGSRADLKTFVNDWLAEPWDEARAYDFKEVKLEVFSSENIPQDGSVPIMSVDVQVNGFWALVRKFAPPTEQKPYGESWLLFADWVQTEEELADIQKDYDVIGENVTMDMARKPNQVGRMIIAHDWRGIWGSPNTEKFIHRIDHGTFTERLERPYSEVKFRDPMLGTKWESRTFDRARFVFFAKNYALDLVSSLRYAEPTIFHITVNVSPRYSRHMNSRVKRQEKDQRTGRVKWTWVELHQENHLMDLEEHVAIRALQLGLISPPPESETQNVK